MSTWWSSAPGSGGSGPAHVPRDGLSVAVLEAGDGIGGVWFWNRYPGARCDVESYDYSYAFSEELEQEWRWSERYATQPEILRYIEHVADRFDLRRDVHLRHAHDRRRVRRREPALDGHHGPRRPRARPLPASWPSAACPRPKRPTSPGLDDFAGAILYTARWPHEGVDFAGMRVGVIGTGSSGIQAIPVVASRPRTSPCSSARRTTRPAAQRPLTPRTRTSRPSYPATRRRAESPIGLGSPPTTVGPRRDRRGAPGVYEQAWKQRGFILPRYHDLLLNQGANDTAADFIRAKIREIVRDPLTREAVPAGSRSAPSALGSTATTSRPSTATTSRSSTSARSRSRASRRTACRRADEHYELDVLVFATGFDAMTGSLLRDRHPRAATADAEDTGRAARGPTSASASPASPTCSPITGPGSPSVLSNC